VTKYGVLRSKNDMKVAKTARFGMKSGLFLRF